MRVFGGLHGYERGWLRFDLVAALTTWALVVPQAIAYGQLAGLQPQAGLYAAFAGLLAYAVFATSRHLVVSPTSSTAIISAALVAPLAGGDADQYASLSAMLAVLVGVAFVGYGLLHLGFISQFIATSVQTGLMFGLGLTIIATQIPDLFGITGTEGTFLDQVADIAEHVGETNPWTLGVGVVGLTGLLALRRFAPAVPAALVVVAGAIAAVAFLGLDDRGVEVIGQVDSGFPVPAIPTADLSDVAALLTGALAISLLGYAESDTVAEQFAGKHGYDIESDRELIALGSANLAAGLFQGFIVAGGASQTAASESAGAKSQLSGLIVSGLILLTSLFLMPVFSDLPQAILAAIVISAVIGFINVPAMRRIRALRRDSFVLSLVTLFAVLVLGMLPGLILSIAISIALVLAHAARPGVSILGRLPGRDDFASVATNAEAREVPGLLIVRPDAPLLAFNARHVRTSIVGMATKVDPPTRVVLVDLEMSTGLDIGSVDGLADLRDRLSAAKIDLWLARAHPRTMEMLDRSGLVEKVGRGHVFQAVGEGVAAFVRADFEHWRGTT